MPIHEQMVNMKQVSNRYLPAWTEDWEGIHKQIIDVSTVGSIHRMESSCLSCVQGVGTHIIGQGREDLNLMRMDACTYVVYVYYKVSYIPLVEYHKSVAERELAHKTRLLLLRRSRCPNK